MKPATLEWVQKAEADFHSARYVVGQPHPPNHDLVCFLIQQSMEKYLKACLQEQGVPFPKTHDLEELLDLILPFAPQYEVHRQNLQVLTHYAVDYRYPGVSSTAEQAATAIDKGIVLREFIRKHLGLL